MKKLLVFLAISLLMFVSLANAGEVPIKEEYWNNLPDRWKVHFVGAHISEHSKHNAFEISGVFFKEKVLKKFWGEDWLHKRKELQSEIKKVEEEWLNRAVLLFHISSSKELQLYSDKSHTAKRDLQ